MVIILIEYILFKSVDLDIMVEIVWIYVVKVVLWLINVIGWLVCVMEDVSLVGWELYVIREMVCIYSLLDVFVFFGLKWMVVNWVIVYLYVIGNKSEYILFFNIKLFNILIKWSLFEVIYLLYMDFDNFDFR